MADFFASTAKGLESLCLDELKALGAQECKQTVAGVSFTCDWPTAYKICMWSRVASRILLRLVETQADNVDELYQAAYSIPWNKYFNVDQTFSVHCSGTNHYIDNSQFGALKVKDAIVDQFNKTVGSRPNVAKTDEDARIVVRLASKYLAISIDLSGASLHRRGYRTEQGEAPVRENLASALVTRSNWQEKYLIDPMCGSGTILIEAAMQAADIAPGLNRSFGFERLSNFAKFAWSDIQADAKTRAETGLTNCKQRLIGYDIDRRMVAVAKANIERAGLSDIISVHVHDAANLPAAPNEPGLILSNPPYGERLGELTKLIGLFLSFGASVRENYPGWRLSLFTAAPELLDYLRLRSDKQYKFLNGALNCVLKIYQIGEGGQGSQRKYAEDFVNRLLKNKKKLQKWIKRDNITCYRLYDADLPEYNVAVDCYDDYVIVQEYRAPKTIEPAKARRRLMDLLTGLLQSDLVANDKLVIKQRSQQKGRQQYERNSDEKERFVVQEYGAQFYVNLTDYLDTGLFLDHRNMRHYIQQNSNSKSVLNLFAYTGSASVHAAIGGASKVTTVDMSNTYLNWAKDNFRLNQLPINKHEFIRADCMAWLKTQISQRWDLIFLDPPTFSNSKKMEEVFDIQKDHIDLLASVSRLLNPGGKLIFSNNKRQFKMDKDGLAKLGLSAENISSQSLSPDFERNKQIHNCWMIHKD
ncbi:bifunctional 23S rRNA (guanine(2069)-N(7))-methyltransferase RlmK/23S rRNA (guanine(2445)-N(2))-methyltransferase RlmL [Agarivorans sp. 1_MG-2023]|uniref:bifunctional 23S rRNA (guanine(2069)-N(7))-methyltransferase RlmK/23S rRNA (guanine(2445)-N(2))-methyltransferase RlmL n=1 Tax=Agarivorans sp. 1_MG-2023 TaxID=3062634 RepID=UPI0026E2E746|nr:bifunctional 23S rRNA (guanine(2069)-N(7))-methyltransferase RlmK/23S rRNA (guanine(2445)-N(2))-methyltransferase RlmL [Agarivorans sp. 1_MG-2023]MDO6766158.1 bifunctional 23S rRNA (guanine(2069)-N(7))-methyltransferase RlmK/23S rRNA (guanine(2445)-N(2))-methyltransferase RlmL [Agarivorans sp. 1_MG-2023]